MRISEIIKTETDATVIMKYVVNELSFMFLFT